MSGAPKALEKLTDKSDTKGVDVLVCDPGWFDKRDSFKIANAPKRTAELAFTGLDLNYAARVLYAEASGSAQLTDKPTRMKEKEAILNVKHFRLNRAGYPNAIKAKSFSEVCTAKNQFESVYAGSPKFSGSAPDLFERLKKAECSDLAECVGAIKAFLAAGPNKDMVYDNFRGGAGSRGEVIGKSRFFLSPGGKKMYENEE